MHTIETQSSAQTMDVAKRFAALLQRGDIVLLEGDLGAGKTTFVKGLASALNVDVNQVTSPTFVLMNHYQGTMPMYHFDLYRLEDPKQLKTVHLDEYLFGQGISLIEWPKRLGGLMPQEYWLIELKHINENTRQICISYPSKPQRSISL